MITVFLQCLWDMKIPFWAMFSIFENMIMRHARDVIFPKFLTEFFQLALHTIVVEMIVTLIGIRRKLYPSAINSSNSSHSHQERKLSRLTFKFWIVWCISPSTDLCQRAHAQNITYTNSLWWSIYFISSEDKTKIFFHLFFHLRQWSCYSSWIGLAEKRITLW